MGLWESVTKWFKTEAESARDVANDLESDWSADLDRREAELRATPEEKLQNLQDKIADNESSFDEIRAKVESGSALADARAELADNPEVPTHEPHSPSGQADAAAAAASDSDDLDIEDAVLVDEDPVDQDQGLGPEGDEPAVG